MKHNCRNKRKKAQSSTEYIMLAAFVFFGMVVAVGLLYKYSASSYSEMTSTQIDKLCWDIIDTSESVYYMGVPARETIETIMPEGVTNITVFTNDPASTGCTKCSELRFTLKDASGTKTIICSTNVNITGTFSSRSRTQGKKDIRIDAKKNHVLINMTV